MFEWGRCCDVGLSLDKSAGWWSGREQSQEASWLLHLGLQVPDVPTTGDSLCLVVISGLEQDFSSEEGLVALQASGSFQDGCSRIV